MRKTILIILCCVVVLLAGYAGYRAYKTGKQSHLMSLAHQFLAKSDRRNAMLCVQQVLRSNPRNVEATRLMAELAEAARLPSALLWRSRVVELSPHSLKDRLALAQTALMTHDYATATNALEGVAAADKKTASYQSVAGAVAAAANHPAEAEAHFIEASRLEPNNPVPQLNLAVLRLLGTNAAEQAEARATLEYLSANPTNSILRVQALRELTADALRHGQNVSALALSRQLLQETNSVFADHLLRLDVLQQARNPEFKTALANCQHEAKDAPAKIYELATWQMAKTSPGDALAWLRSLPRNLQTNQPAALLMTECYTLVKDWHGLQVWIEPQNWGELEFVRHAFLSHALRSQQMTDSAKVEWERALAGANGQKQSLIMLLRLTASWKWVSENEELLQTIVNRYPDQQWAAHALVQTMIAGGQTRPLMILFSEQLKLTPSDATLKNNLAQTALLLGAQEFKPNDLAREVYQKFPTNPAFASTYAFSLYLQGKNAEALKVMQKLTAKALDDPSIAGYYGLILKATGNREAARTYLAWALKSPHLLPEERQLFARAS